MNGTDVAKSHKISRSKKVRIKLKKNRCSKKVTIFHGRFDFHCLYRAMNESVKLQFALKVKQKSLIKLKI